MPPDWRMSVPPELSTAEVMEIRDKLRAGTMTVHLPDNPQSHAKAKEWWGEMNGQILEAFEREATRRLS
jgi:hypothetical protein